jgi:glycosyltransferase involved in cell wall biosynthesis
LPGICLNNFFFRMPNFDLSIPIVSICCVTYNHEKYIDQCLNGFMLQQTNFAFEVLVHEDASTDKTALIVKEYETKYPNLFRCIYQKENQFLKQNTLVNILFPMARGKYLVLCEGDDYWTDPLKLQKQVDFLEANPAYSFCYHKVDIQNEASRQIGKIYNDPVQDVTTPDIIRSHFIPTLGLVFRNYPDLIERLSWMHDIRSGDRALELTLSLLGKGKYLDESMGVYRYTGQGVSTSYKGSKNSIGLSEIYLLTKFNEVSEFRWHKEIREKCSRIYLTTLQRDIQTGQKSTAIKRFVKNLFNSRYPVDSIFVLKGLLNYKFKKRLMKSVSK